MTRQSLEIAPVLPRSPIRSNQNANHIAATLIPNTPIIPERPPSPEKKALHDSNTFLTALAAQERRVLELREELQKAEVDLQKLKESWRVYEAARKRNELRRLEPLQPLSAPLVGLGDSDAARTSREEERRKLKLIPPRQPQRTVFSGSRHTKTLSLLSPKPGDSLVPDSQAPAKTRRVTIDRPKTVPDSSGSAATSSHQKNTLTSRQSIQGQPRDAIVETGKQLVGDLREGLWTFFEDLRQATVGEDIDTSAGSTARNHTGKQNMEEEGAGTPSENHNMRPAHLQARGSSMCENDKHSCRINAEDGSTINHNVRLSLPASNVRQQRHTTAHTVVLEADGWDNWDSPPRHCSPTLSSTKSQISDSMASPVTDRSTPRSSISSTDATPRPTKTTLVSGDRKEIPWPALTKLSPGNLKRTASSYMNDWERNLTSPNGESKDSASSRKGAQTKEKKAE